MPFDLSGCYAPGHPPWRTASGCPSWVFSCVHVLPVWSRKSLHMRCSLVFCSGRGSFGWALGSAAPHSFATSVWPAGCNRLFVPAWSSGARIRLPGDVPPGPLPGVLTPRLRPAFSWLSPESSLPWVVAHPSASAPALGRCVSWWLIHHPLFVANVVSRDSRCCSCRLVGYGRVSSWIVLP